MANELRLDYTASKTITARLVNAAGLMYHVASGLFEAYGADGHADASYANSLTDKGSGVYRGDFPTAIAAGVYTAKYYDSLVATSVEEKEIIWNGSSAVTIESSLLAGVVSVASSGVGAISITNICNMALSKLGDRPHRISSYSTDDGTTAQWCRDLFPAARNEAFARMDWSCLRKVAELTLHDNDPEITEWSYKYARPDDCVVLRKVQDAGGEEGDFLEIEDSDGAFIYSNISSARARYSYLNEDANAWTTGLVQLLYWTLAEKLALPITGKATIQQAMLLGLNNYADRVARAAQAVEAFVADEHNPVFADDPYK